MYKRKRRCYHGCVEAFQDDIKIEYNRYIRQIEDLLVKWYYQITRRLFYVKQKISFVALKNLNKEDLND